MIVVRIARRNTGEPLKRGVSVKNATKIGCQNEGGSGMQKIKVD